MFDLAADQMKAAPWLKGVVPVFSPDDKLIYVAAHSTRQPYRSGRGYVDEIRVHDFNGKRVRSYPLRMNMVGRLSFSTDGRTLIVDGGTGVGLANRAGGTFTPSHQIINLKTGKSMCLKSPEARNRPAFGPGRLADFAAMNLQTIPARSATLDQQLTNALWDASTSSLAVTGRGRPEGGTIKLWNLKEGKFAVTVGTSNNIRNTVWLGPGLLAGTAWYDRKTLPPELAALPTPPGSHGSATLNLVTLVQLPEGTRRPLGISARHWAHCPSPDGRYLAGLISPSVEGFTPRLQIWDTKRSVLVGEISAPKQSILGFHWTSDGRFLIVLLRGEDGKRRWEFFTPKGISDGVVAKVSNYAVRFSPRGHLVAVQAKGPPADAWTDTYRTSVRKSRTGEEVATFPGSTLPAETVFLDGGRLLIASKRAGEPIRLLRLGDRKVLWEVEVAGETRRISWQPDWTAVVVHYGTNAGADVLSIKDGRRLPAGEGQRPGWHNPTLLHGGRLALDPLCDSSILRLKETDTGRTIATFAAFADPEWIIYTPDGLWTGSPKASDWVAFYRGTDPLPPEEIAALRQPKAVRARLAAAFR